MRISDGIMIGLNVVFECVTQAILIFALTIFFSFMKISWKNSIEALPIFEIFVETEMISSSFAEDMYSISHFLTTKKILDFESSICEIATDERRSVLDLSRNFR